MPAMLLLRVLLLRVLLLLLLLLSSLCCTGGSKRGVFWAVGRDSPSAVDFLLGNNTRHWANTSLPVSEMTRGILQCCNSVAINRSGHLLADYHNATQGQLRPGAFAPFRQRDVDVFVDIGAAEGAGGLNCSNVPQSGSPNSTCVTPAQICQAALLRKEAFAAEVLALTMDHNLSGVTVDWEYQYGNNQTCFAALWRHVSGVLSVHQKAFAPFVNNGGGWQGPDWYVSTEWDYWSYLPWASRLLNMGSYRVKTPDDTGSVVPVPCASVPDWHRFTENATGRWCGLEGTIADMLGKGATPAQIVPAVWMDQCVNGTATKTGWTESVLREFLEFAGQQGIRELAVWTDSAINSGGPNGDQMDDPGLATCPWFVPALLEWSGDGAAAR
eukprot:COSAG06_NODE_120_length_23106_cov_18.311862_30_plen_384_part_00